jgi:hypothetical protein
VRAGEPAPPGRTTEEAPAFRLGAWTLSGDATQYYRFRTMSADSDQDLYGYLRLDASTPAGGERQPAYRGLEFHLQASYTLDIDAFERARGISGGSFFPFLDLTNTFDDRLHAFLYELNAEAKDVFFLERVRAGRQQVWRDYGFLFDGALLSTHRWHGFGLEVFGGLPARLYEDSPSGDALAGVSLFGEPAAGLTVGIDYVFNRDRRQEAIDGRSAGEVEDHVVILRGGCRITSEWTASASASWVDGRDRRQVVEAQYLSEGWGHSARLRALRQNGVVEIDSTELSPYVFVEGRYAPHYQLDLDLEQPLGEVLAIGGGLRVRELEDSGDAGAFNHSFRNYHLSLHARGLWEGSVAALTGEAWDADGEDIYTLGFELEQKVVDLLRARFGTSYSLYRFDPLSGEERDHDRVYYARLRWSLGKRLSLDTDYQYEVDSVTEYHTLTTGVRLTF